jgi:ABC-type Fe3+/spermidine/putrescine transport system ATPase subunit
VRPESLRLEKTGGPGSSFLVGKVTKIVYLGPTVEYELVVDGLQRSIAAVVSDPIQAGFYHLGEEVALDFHPQAAHLLPA